MLWNRTIVQVGWEYSPTVSLPSPIKPWIATRSPSRQYLQSQDGGGFPNAATTTNQTVGGYAHPTCYIQVAEPAAVGVAAVTSLKVATTGGSATALPTGQGLTWTWNGSGTPTWVIVRSDGSKVLNQTLTPGSGTQTNGTWSWTDQNAPISSVNDPGIWSYTISAVTTSGTSPASVRAFAPQIYMLLGYTQGDFDGLRYTKFYDSNASSEMHWFNWSFSPGVEIANARTAIQNLPSNAPLVIAGDSFGGGLAVQLSRELNGIRNVKYLALFDPVGVHAFAPQPGINVLPDYHPDQYAVPTQGITELPITDPHSTFELLSNVEDAHDWYQTYAGEYQYNTVHGITPHGYATGYIINAHPTTSLGSWITDRNIGDSHTSQVTVTQVWQDVNAEIHLPKFTWNA